MRLTLRLEHLYPIAAVALGGFVVALLPIVPHDFWWHMAIGRDIAHTGSIPRVDTYSWSMPPGTPFIYQSWLSELIFYLVHAAGGLPAIVWLRNMLVMTSLTVAAVAAYRRSGSWRLAGLASAGIAAMTINNVTMRPQSFSWLPFLLFATLLAAYRAGRLRERPLFWLPLIMAVWVNLHGAFILGLIMLLLTSVGETAKLLLALPGMQSRRRVGFLWLIVGLSLLAAFLNPNGPGVFAYVFKLLTDPPSQGLVIEWQPVSVVSFVGLVFVVTILLYAALSLRMRTPPDLTELLIWIAFLWIAASGVRYVLWFAMLSWPAIAEMLAHARSGRARRTPPNLVNTVLASLIVLLPLSVQPPFKSLWPLPPVFAGLGPEVANGPLVSAFTPVQAAAWLQEHPLPPGARVFNDQGYGSYLIWATPAIKVYVDPRVELYPLPEWLRYKRIVAACNYNRELQELGVTHLILDRAGQPSLIDALETDSAWQQLYDDPQTIIYARVAAGAAHDACVTF
jgi:hypothetical protein